MTAAGQLNERYGASETTGTCAPDGSQRQRDLLLAAVLNARYAPLFEPACGHGELSPHLARRGEALRAVDALLRRGP